MAKYYGCMLVQRILFPTLLAACCLFRPVALSLLYLLMLFLLPFVPVATPATIKGRTGTYFKILILISTLTSISHGVFEIVLLSIGYDKLEFCGLTEKILRHIGFIRLSDLQALSVIVWIAPELVLLLASIGVYFILKMMANGRATPPQPEEEAISGTRHLEETADEPGYTVEKYSVICGAAKVLSMAALLLASVMRPSVPSGIYFLMFLTLSTWWACYGKLERGFAIISRVIMLFLSIHIIAFMIYQTPWPQEFFPSDNLLPRLLGFVPLFISTCDNATNGTSSNGTYVDDIRIVNFNTDAPIDAVLNPVIILLCFYTLAISSTMILHQKDIKQKAGGVLGQLENGTKFGPQLSVKIQNVPPVARKIGTREKWKETTKKVKAREYHELSFVPTEQTPLMRRSTRRMRLRSLTGRHSRDGDGIPMNEMGNDITSTEEETSGILDSFFTFIQNITGFIFKHCYIFMNIAMMTWSIMYHSWLTFILLIWANVLWIIPNQRKTMLQSSPFVVFYAELLLLAQYIYGMDLTEDELPASIDINGINLSQIGLVKYTYMPCGPLIMKTIFTLMFWVTLRQLTKERREQRQTSTLADMVAPLQVTVGAATADLAPRSDEKAKESQFITRAVILLDAFLTRFWIWIVVITLFVSGIAGQRMTGFRIIYMALFLVFLLTFQVSWRAWKKMMYGFWLTVIIYAMVILVLVYTYQFDRFPQYWSEYLNISETLQGDIGLEKYQTRDLFLNLAIPTLVVVMTVLQLHYFHGKFLTIIEPPEGINLETNVPNTGRYRNLEESDESPKNTKGKKSFISKALSLTGLSKQEIYEFFGKVKEKIILTYETIMLFLDIHLIKLVIFIGFIVCVKEPCFLHIFFTAIIVIAALGTTDSQILISRIYSVIVAVLFLAKMIYQVKYIKHTNYDVMCDNVTNPNGINNADWFGFHKISENSTLPTLLRNYIGYIAIVTIDAIIRYHQKIKRIKNSQPPERPDVMFPEVTRKDAEQNLTYMLQYLANYAFHRFGVEVCLILTVIVIGIRMDIIALFYTIWLCFLFAAKREKMAMLWPAFQWFSALSIVVQYIVIVGVPPGLCLSYPWSEGILRNLQMWAMLPDATLFRISQKIVPDFILLMLVTRQRIVFRIERDWLEREQEFPGGTNKSILSEIEGFIGKKFENPTPDFTSNVRNWLDVLKRGFIMSFFWLALAIVFLTGANRVNLFSVGYLIGSFTFLWQGSDFYLRPVRTILRWWLRLIAYNVFVITTKTILQIPGCLFYKTLEDYCCWLIQLLSIVCTQKLKVDATISSIKIKCTVNADQASILWDVICFAFLVIQYRIFQSYYFCHVVNETKAGIILASRGAELIEELRQKKMKQEMEAEAKILKKLKMKMDRIKATQKKFLLPVVEEPKTHAQDDHDDAPLARTQSLSSCAGFHTPIDDEVAGSLLNDVDGSDIPSEIAGLGPVTSRGGSLLLTQAPSPSSAIMTVSLDGYLEPHRLSFSSPPGSELIAAQGGSDESYPVFSPPPFDEERSGAQNNSLQPPTKRESHRQHRRQSSLNTVSWPDQFDGGTRNRLASSNLDPPDEADDASESPRLRHGHRRESSMATSWAVETLNPQRRASDISWAVVDDEISARSVARRRPFSWGPVGEISFRQSIISTSSRSPVSHHESIRSGDYYMFEELDDKLELDLLTSHKSDDDIEDQQQEKLQKKMGLGELISTKINERNVHRSSESDPGLSPSFHRRSERESKKGRKSYQKFDSGRSVLSEPLPSHIGGGEDDDDDVSSKLTSSKHHREDADELDREKPGPSHAYKSPSDSDDDDDPTERQHLKRSDSDDTMTEVDGEDERPRGRLVGLKLIWAFIEGAMISLIIRLNRISRHYRYVVRVLAREKIELKNSPDFGIGRRAGNMMWIPQRINSEQSTESSTTETERHHRATVSESDVRLDTDNAPPEGETDEKGLAANYAALQQAVLQKPKPQEEEEPRRESVVPEIRIMAPSLERGLDEVTPSTAKVEKPKIKDRKFKVDEIEDFSEKEHSSVVELLMACWFAILSNTDLVCYFTVFINQINSASILSLPLPFMVFCWGTLTVPRPSKTFWVTLIAYTQIVVLLKCVSQFELLWWNEQAIPPNTPLAPARIIGIEKKKNYATYDLALLLVLFFHRFMLKTLGLWKSDFKEEPISEGTYQVNQQHGSQNDKALVKKDDEADKKTEDGVGSNQAIAIAKVHTETILCPSTDMQLIQVTDVKEQPTSIIPPVVKLSFNRHCSAFRIFFGQLLDRSSRVSADVYAYMFFCDFINFMVVLFGFTSFGSQQGDGGVTAYLEENKVPLAFLIMLILQFILIIIDRALYLRKYMLGKIIFQYGLTVGIHIWMFFVLPAVTERSFNAKNPPVIWYLIKCFYLLFSAYQIRCGYPTRILGNFLTRSFSLINSSAYKAYMFIPFLFELRTLMDWIWTDTSMTLFDWLKMEDIFANMYQLKCSRKLESDFPAPRGQKKTTLVKYLMGGGMLFGLITIIWFPLGLFALGNTVGESNPPYDVSVTMKIGPFEPIYFANAQGANIQKFTEDDWLSLNQPYKRDKTAVTFLTNYEATDVAVVDLGPNSTSVWAISPPDLQRMREDIESNDTLKIIFRYTVSRITYSKENPGVITDETSYDITHGDPIRQVLSGMLSNQTAGNVTIPHLLPKFLKVKNNGVLKPIPQLIPSDYPETSGYRNITLKLFEADNVRWWELKEDCSDQFYADILKDIPKSDCNKAIVIYTFNDKLFPPTLSWLTAGGIIGMYTTFVILISRFLRGIFSGSSFKIMFDDLPYVDRVLQLCLDIYLVRESMDFALEEDLFAKLIFLYRSPETMIKWTRPKEDEAQGDDDDDTSSMRSSSKAVRRKAA